MGFTYDVMLDAILVTTPPNVQIMPPWHWVGLELTWWLMFYWWHLSPSGLCQNLGTSSHFPFKIDLVTTLG
jgi:hypothetical protein